MRVPVFQIDDSTTRRFADFRAFQAARRGGEIRCRLSGERVELEGSCVFYREGEAIF